MTLRHPDQSTCLAFSPDGTRLASGGTDGSVRIWDVATGVELQRYAIPDAVSAQVAFSSDGKVLAVHFNDQKVRFLDTKTFREQKAIHSENLSSLSLSRDAGLIAGTGFNRKLLLLETSTGLDRLEIPDGLALALAPDASFIAAASEEDVVTIYEIPAGKPRVTVRHPSREGVTSIAISPAGDRFVTADDGDTARVRVWDAKTGKIVSEWPGLGPVAVFPDGSVVGRRDGGIVNWMPGSERSARVIVPSASVYTVTADGKTIATGGRGSRIRLWDVAKGTERFVSAEDHGDVVSLVADRDALIIGTSSELYRWLPGDKPVSLLANLSGPLAFSGSKLLVAQAQGIGIWDHPTRALAPKPHRSLERGPGATVAMSGNASGSRVAIADAPNRIRIADPATGTVLKTWTLPSGAIDIALGADNNQLTAVCTDGSVRSYDLRPDVPTELWKARIARSRRAGIATPSDGRYVAVASIIRVNLFDSVTGTALATFDRAWDDGPYQSIAVSPDGRLIAAGAQGSHGPVIVWEVATRSVVRRFAGGTGSTHHVTFFDGGRRIATVGSDENVIAYDLAEPKLDSTKAWEVLDRIDAGSGVAAMFALAEAGPKAVTIIRQGMTTASETRVRISRLIAQLDANDFQDRQAAGVALKGLGANAIDALIIASDSHASPEVRQRAEALVADLAKLGTVRPEHGLHGEKLRLLRAIAVLERIKTADAVKLLEVLASKESPVAADATATLRRLGEK